MARIAVVGAGYVGLVTGACLAKLGHNIVCLEIDKEKLHGLKQGISPIHEPGLDHLLAETMTEGRLRFSGDFGEVSNVEFAFIAVPTPPAQDGSADTGFVFRAVQSAVAHAGGPLTLVIKSTVPVGTGDQIAMLPEVRARGIEVVSNPEFLRQGTAVRNFLSPDRVVIGASSLQAGVDVARLYSAIDAPIIAVSRRSAELAKYTANAFLATRISFMNEISHIASAAGADIDDVARIIGTDSRIGPAFLKAGLGWGGSCFPKDILALSSVGETHGCPTPILNAVHEINERQADHAVERVLAAVRGATDPLVAILGLSFKPDTDDVRGSPALRIAQRLLKEGVIVRGQDPAAITNANRVLPGLEYHSDPYFALEGADVLIVATEWQEYLALDWALVREMMRGNTVLDGRNFLNADALEGLGFRYLSFGRRSLNGFHPGILPFDETGDLGQRAAS